MDSSAEEELRKLIAEPDTLDVLAAAVARSGAWRGWTFERQTWFLRRRMGLTQAELARRSGVSQHRISRIEAGEDLKLSTLRSLWRALGCEPLVLPDALDLPREPRLRRRRGAMSCET
jgi:DNA-binding XRE family transcriptional regulator